MLPIAAVALLLACLFDPVLWTLAVCGVLLGRKLAWPSWLTVLAGAGLATAGTLLLLAILNTLWTLGFIELGARLTASLLAAWVVLLILRAFDKRKAK